MRFVAAGVLGAILVACSGSASVATPGAGLTKAQAVAAAQKALPGSTGVVDARVGRMADFDPNQGFTAADRLVWAVVLSGSFPGSCGPAPLPGATMHPCPPPARTATVILDFRTGEFLVASMTGGR